MAIPVTFDLQATGALDAAIKPAVTAIQTLTATADSGFAAMVAKLDQVAGGLNTVHQATVKSTTATTAASAGWKEFNVALFGTVTAANLAASAIKDIAGEIVGAEKASIDAASEVEGLQIAFTGLEGSSQAAQARLTELRDFANHTPFEFGGPNGVAKFAQQLEAVGLAGQAVKPVLTDIGNAVAAAGGSDTQLKEVALAYEQIHSKGKLAGQEVLQLANANIPVHKMLADALHLTVAEVVKLQEQGAITSDVFERAFHTYTVEHFGGAMDKQSQTMKGLVSTAEDLQRTLAAAFGEGQIKALEPEVKKLTDELSDPRTAEAIRGWGQAFGDFEANVIRGVEKLAAAQAQLDRIADPEGAARADARASAVKELATATQQLAADEALFTNRTSAAASANDAWVLSMGLASGAAKEQATALRDLESTARDAQAEIMTGLDNEISGLRKEADTAKRSTDDTVAGFKTQAAAAKDASDATIAGLRDQAETAKRGQEDAVAGVRLAAEAAKRASADATFAVDSEIRALQSKNRLLDQSIEKRRQDREISKLSGDLERDKLLAGNIYSDTGGAAAQRVRDNTVKLADLRDTQAVTQTKTATTNQIADLEDQKRAIGQQSEMTARRYADETAAIERTGQTTQRRYADEIKATERQAQADARYYADQVKLWQDRGTTMQRYYSDEISNIEAAKTAQKQHFDAWTHQIDTEAKNLDKLAANTAAVVAVEQALLAATTKATAAAFGSTLVFASAAEKAKLAADQSAITAAQQKQAAVEGPTPADQARADAKTTYTDTHQAGAASDLFGIGAGMAGDRAARAERDSRAASETISRRGRDDYYLPYGAQEPSPSAPTRALGGPVSAGRIYEVHEREYFIPSRDGQVTSGGAGGQITINLNVMGVGLPADQSVWDRVARQIQIAVSR